MQSCLPRLTHTNMSVVNNMKAAVTVGVWSPAMDCYTDGVYRLSI